MLTICAMSDDVGAVVEIATGGLDIPTPVGGRPRVARRAAFDAVTHRRRTGRR
jgi:hypothetical protein